MRTSFQAAAVRVAALIATLAGLSGPALAQTPAPSPAQSQPISPRQWTVLRLPEYGFMVEFPAIANQGNLENGEIRWAVELDNGWTAYLVSTVTLTEERVRTAGPKGVLDGAVEGGRNRFPQGTILSHTEIQLGGSPGREFVMQVNLDGTMMRIASRVVLSGRQLYVLTAVQRESALDQREIDRVLRSLALISQ